MYIFYTKTYMVNLSEINYLYHMRARPGAGARRRELGGRVGELVTSRWCSGGVGSICHW